ncbi:hypothetical protein [Bacillus suaedae]|uniref:Tetratricopeptide repeat protein n=1 Tax=Halalkalibacter suaedae TaxID=2822140 RepID=A0A940WV18_9BACI|nr:hypothetical protein [Bacillus suaedae]MBP3950808.1 hypothetical protein [Bacillus suaedae]
MSKENNTEFKEAITLHQKGINGDKKAAEKAFKQLKELKLMNHNDPLIEAYYGSASALVARDHANLMEKTNYAKRGMKALDHAVTKDSSNMEIRMLRGNVAFRLPEMHFKRTSTAIEDFLYLIAAYEKEKGKGTITKDQYEDILFKLGKAYKNSNEDQKAKDVWTKLSSKNPKYKKQIEKG